MVRNSRRETVDKRRLKQRTEGIISWAILGALILMLAIYWYMDDDYYQFLDRHKIDNLIELRAYDSVLSILDTAMKKPEYQPIKDDLNKKRQEVAERIKIEKPSFTFGIFRNNIDTLRAGLLFDSAIVLSNIALKDSNYSQIEKDELKELLIRLNDDKNKLDRGDKVSIPTTYKVKTGETVNGIAYRHNMTPMELMTMNKLNDNKIKEGALLKVNVQIIFAEHVVKTGENLTNIANKYKTTIEKIRKLNKMSHDVVNVGQKIKIGYTKVSIANSKPAEPN